MTYFSILLLYKEMIAYPLFLVYGSFCPFSVAFLRCECIKKKQKKNKTKIKVGPLPSSVLLNYFLAFFLLYVCSLSLLFSVLAASVHPVFRHGQLHLLLLLLSSSVRVFSVVCCCIIYIE